MTPYQRALALIEAKHRRDNSNRRVFTHDKAQAQYVELDPDTGVIRYNYRGTDVAILNQLGEILLDTGGWPTASTKRCMERVFSSTDVTVNILGSNLRNGEMPKHPKPWYAEAVAWDGEKWHRHVLGYFEDSGDGVHVITGIQQYRGTFTWGSNVSDYPRQNLLITPAMLDSIPDRRAA